jgi:membrane protein implicated in regulation of membrane protease activity
MKKPFLSRLLSNQDSTKIQDFPKSNYSEILREIATVTDAISPNKPGRIRYQGSWWPALCIGDEAILAGATVRVIEIVNITCIVELFEVEK